MSLSPNKIDLNKLVKVADPQSGFKYVLPEPWQNPKHPNHLEATAMVKAGTAFWGATMRPKNSVFKNIAVKDYSRSYMRSRGRR